EAGVDDFLAQATPKDKLEYIKKEQAGTRGVIGAEAAGAEDNREVARDRLGVIHTILCRFILRLNSRQ
ncbi:MAG: hypothetical protein LAO07_18585, partial [Acidobacteriia bacterium]|nr:hypothetical protein [Terriglobia bacterium]